MLAQSCLNAKKAECAVEQFRLLLQQSPESAPTHVLMAQALDGLGEIDEAIAEFQAAARISPNEPNVHYALGHLLWRAQRYEDARKEFEQELAHDAKHEQALAYLADIEWKNDPPDAAVPLLLRALKVNRDYRFAYVELGTIYLAQRNYKEAEPVLLRAVKLDPREPDAHYQLGRLYRALGKKMEAERELEKVQELREKDDQSVRSKIPSTPTKER